MSYKLRKPNKKELDDLRQYLRGLGQDEETVEIIANSHFFGVIDDYISDCPAFAGKLMFAVYGMPEFYEVFIWEDDKLSRVELDDGFLYRKQRYLKNLNKTQLAQEFDSLIDNFANKYHVEHDEILDMMIGWIDYYFGKMGELEKEIKNAIKKMEKKK
jgi:hypothetical protein